MREHISSTLPKSAARVRLTMPEMRSREAMDLSYTERKFSRGINDTNASPAVQGASLKSPITL